MEPAKHHIYKDSRAREIAQIHWAKRELGLEEDIYREILEREGGHRSAADLTPLGRAKVLRYFAHIGWHRLDSPKPAPKRTWQKGPKPSQDRAPMIAKIDAMLYEAGRDRAYAVACLRQMFGASAPERLEWATPEQLHKLVASLVYDAKRHGRRAK